MVKEDRQIEDILGHFQDCRILVIGDLMTDKYVWGNPERISREAPVAVVKVNTEEYRLGGAANVAHNVRALGAEVYLCGLVGYDDAAHYLRKAASEAGISTGGIFPSERRVTTTKVRIMSEQYRQQLLRIDYETALTPDDEEIAVLSRYIAAQTELIDAVILSDYEKGIFGHPEMVQKTISLAKKRGIIVVVDGRTVHLSSYAKSTLLALNYDDARAFASLSLDREPKRLEEIGNEVKCSAQCDSLLLVKGEEEIALFLDGGEVARFPLLAQVHERLDFTGVRDTIIGVLTLSMVAGANLNTAVRMANMAADKVIRKVGTATVSVKELLSA